MYYNKQSKFHKAMNILFLTMSTGFAHIEAGAFIQT